MIFFPFLGSCACLPLLLFLLVLATVQSEDTDPPHRPYRSQRSLPLGATTFASLQLFEESADSCGLCCYTIESSLPDDFDSFYEKGIDLNGYWIVSSGQVRDTALAEAALIQAKLMEGRPDLLQTLVEEGVKLAVIGENEVTTDIPEYSDLNEAFPGTNWDVYRGLGATSARPTSSCAEENLLCRSSDVYRGEDICVHESAHTLSGGSGALPTARDLRCGGDDDFDAALEQAYDSAMEAMQQSARKSIGPKVSSRTFT